MNKNIVLIGFMGSGKSMIACELGKRLKAQVVATDALVEAREGKTIHEIFESKGEPYFRNLFLKFTCACSCAGGALAFLFRIVELTFG